MGNYMSNQLSYRHTQRVVVNTAMDAGGCGPEFRWALRDCAGRKKKTADVLKCIESTSRLRQCMEGNKCGQFKTYIEMMDEGLDQDEGKPKRYQRYESAEERWRWRWWTGMIRIAPPPTSMNHFKF